MNWVDQFLPDNIIEALGWTFFHSIWLGIFTSLLLAAALLLINNKYSGLRYKISLAALSVFTISMLYVFFSNYSENRNTIMQTGIFTEPIQATSIGSTGEKLQSLSIEESDLYVMIKNFFSENFSMIVFFWITGLAFFALKFAGGMLYLQKMKTRGLHELDIEWIYRTRELTRRMLKNKFVPVYQSVNVKVPVVIGFLKPIILLPLGIISGLPYNQVEVIIVHELAHIKRYDYLINIMQSFIETLFFYHPAVWWISSRIREERENCCDDLVLENCEDPVLYSRALYNLRNENADQPSLALAAGGNVNNLLRRIKRMNDEKKKLSSGIGFAAVIIVFLLIGTAAAISTSSAAKSNKQIVEASFINPLTFIEGRSSNSVKSSLPDTTSIKKGKRTLKFYAEENGEEKKFKAKLNNGKLEQLYIDGDEVPSKDFDKYEAQIAAKANEYDSAMKEYNAQMGEHKENMKKFKEEMKSFKEKMKSFRGSFNRDFDFDFDFDIPHVYIPHINIPDFDTAGLKNLSREIQKNVHKNLHKHFAGKSIVIPPIHIPKIHIPSIKIPHVDAEKIRRHLKEEFNSQEFRESMKEMRENLSEQMKKLKEELKDAEWNKEEFKESMKNLSKDMDKLKAEMKILKAYLNEVKTELVNDKLINEDDDLDGFYLSKEEMKINDKSVSPELHKKYLELYKKHYGKELDDELKFHIHD